MTTIASDAPIIDPSQDRFSRWSFAQRIAQTIVTRKDPSSIVIGIYGSWGNGKTTVLNFIEKELNQHSEIVSFKFNPWRFSDETRMLLGFFKTLAESVGKSTKNAKELVGEFIGNFLTPVASAIGQGATAENLSKLLSSVEIEVIKSRVNEILLGEGKRVVILIDDIDRLDKNEIQSLFRLVKLNADFVNTAYVLAFDDEMVAAALQEKYSAAGSESGRSFLEKIIQVPLDLPAIPTTSLRDFCFSKINQALDEASIVLSQEEGQSFVRGYINGLEIRIKTPRMATRYGNILSFSLPILKGEVNPVDMMLIEGIRLFYPNIYESIKRNPDVFLRTGVSPSSGPIEQREKDRAKQIIEKGMGDLNSDEKKDALDLLQFIFPTLQGVYGNSYFGNETAKTWAKLKRVASSDYFPRYFAYSIIESDVSDITLEQFIQSLEEKPQDELIKTFIDLIQSKNTEKVISKLRQKTEKFSTKASIILSFIIAGSGNLFPKPEQFMSFRGAFSQAAMLINDLMANIQDKDEMIDYSQQLVSFAQPITFAVEITRWLREKESDGSIHSFSVEEKDTLKRLLANRIKELSSNKNLLIEFPDEACSLLSIWSNWGSKVEASSYLENLLEINSDQVLLLFESIVPTAWEMGSGVSHKGDLDRDVYNYICRIIDPEKIMVTLVKLFGDEFTTKDYPINRLGENTELRMSQQFAWIHRMVVKDNMSKDTISVQTSGQ